MVKDDMQKRNVVMRGGTFRGHIHVANLPIGWPGVLLPIIETLASAMCRAWPATFCGTCSKKPDIVCISACRRRYRISGIWEQVHEYILQHNDPRSIICTSYLLGLLPYTMTEFVDHQDRFTCSLLYSSHQCPDILASPVSPGR